MQIKDTHERGTYECDEASLMSLTQDYVQPIFDANASLSERSVVEYNDEVTKRGSRTVTVELTDEGKQEILHHEFINEK